MFDAANFALLLTGLVPVVVSAVKVEKYYTGYYIGLWNFFGTVLVILGCILDESVDPIVMGWGIFIIVVLTIIALCSKYFQNPHLIRLFGRSTVQCSIVIFFITLNFSNHLYLAIEMSLFTFLLLYITATLASKRAILKSKVDKEEITVKAAQFRIDEFRKYAACLMIPYFLIIILGLFNMRYQGFNSTDFLIGFTIFIILSIFSSYFALGANSYINTIQARVDRTSRRYSYY